MKEDTEYEEISVFEQIKTGLDQALAHGRGELKLKTTVLVPPPPPATRAKVIALRKKLKMSQAVFAAALNVSPARLQSWEQGASSPDQGDLRLIEILIKEPEIVTNLILADDAKPPRRGKVSRKKAAAA